MREIVYEDIIYDSRANGPGSRNVLVTRGCLFTCPGCYNTNLRNFANGRKETVKLVAERLLRSDCDGISITGGEPLAQLEAIKEIILSLREAKQPIILFTGYTKVELLEDDELLEAAHMCDLVVSGRYMQELRVTRGLRGSSNQEFLKFTDVYTQEEIESFPHFIELHSNCITGFPDSLV